MRETGILVSNEVSFGAIEENNGVYVVQKAITIKNFSFPFSSKPQGNALVSGNTTNQSSKRARLQTSIICLPNW
jgi:hypothetical protein